MGTVSAVFREQFLQDFKYRERFLYTCVLFVSAMMAWAVYRSIVPMTVMTAQEHPMRVISLTADTNSIALLYRLRYCKRNSAPAQVIRELRTEDGLVIGLTSKGHALTPGCHEVQLVDFLPTNIPKGAYVLRLTFLYRTNAVTKPPTFETEPFFVR